MNVQAALDLIRRALGEMASAFGREVFDEWGLVNVRARPPEVLAYQGPREAGFREQLPRDVKSLREAQLSTPYEAGGFEFAREGEGEQHDAFLVLGSGVYLFLNNTRLTMQEITAEPRWLGAQRHFVVLAEAFGADPLAV